MYVHCLGARGRIHITEMEDEDAPISTANPLERLKAGDSIKAALLGVVPTKYVSIPPFAVPLDMHCMTHQHSLMRSLMKKQGSPHVGARSSRTEVRKQVDVLGV